MKNLRILQLKTQNNPIHNLACTPPLECGPNLLTTTNASIQQKPRDVTFTICLPKTSCFCFFLPPPPSPSSSSSPSLCPGTFRQTTARGKAAAACPLRQRDGSRAAAQIPRGAQANRPASDQLVSLPPVVKMFCE